MSLPAMQRDDKIKYVMQTRIMLIRSKKKKKTFRCYVRVCVICFNHDDITLGRKMCVYHPERGAALR